MKYVITGANRGIGLELVKQLTARGNEVIATARDPGSARELLATAVRVEALELGPRGFTCVVMHPGRVKTDMGGEGADITPEESVKGLLDVFAGLTPKDNGKFYNYQGQEIPW